MVDDNNNDVKPILRKRKKRMAKRDFNIKRFGHRLSRIDRQNRLRKQDNISTVLTFCDIGSAFYA
jgi:hypothetical protein